MIWRPPSSTRFPYTTLFRSCRGGQPGLGESGGVLQHAAGRPVLRRVVRSTSRRRAADGPLAGEIQDRKSTRLNSSHLGISYAVFCLKKKTQSDYRDAPPRIS